MTANSATDPTPLTNLGVTDLGVAVHADELRTGAICTNPAGEARLVLCARSSVVIVDPMTGAVDQVRWQRHGADDPFISVGGTDGRFWAAAGHLLVEVDPFALTVRTHSPCDDEAILAMGMTVDPQGRIWFATYPSTRLFCHDPATDTTTEHPRVSTTEHYVSHLAFGTDGWLYAGLGTHRKDLIAYHPATGERRSLLADADRVKGSGYVHLGRDGQVYGHSDSVTLHPTGEHEWFRLRHGAMTPIGADQVAESIVAGAGFRRIHARVKPRWEIVDIQLPDHRLVVTIDGEQRTLDLPYTSAGANLSPFTATPDGGLVGTTNHPSRLWTWRDGRPVIDHGSEAIRGVGNICAWTQTGDLLAGAAYAGGMFYLYDPRRPIVAGENPIELARFEEVHRPRAILAHPDGGHVVWSGYGGYGDTGGGIAITAVPADQLPPPGSSLRDHTVLLPHTDVAPDESPVALGVLGDGTVVGATSIETPGGADPVGDTGSVFLLDWTSRTVTHHWRPVPGVRSWNELVVAPDDTVHLVSSDGHHAHIDPRAQRVLTTSDWTAHGNLGVNALIRNGAHAFVIQSNAVIRLDLTTHTATLIAVPSEPLRAGGAVVGADLIVGSGSRLLRLRDVA